MQKRNCSDCGGELVLAVRATQAPTTQVHTVNDGAALISNSFSNWRCGTCGSAFTAAQLREDKREKATLKSN
jgi:ribosomal protein S27AE